MDKINIDYTKDPTGTFLMVKPEEMRKLEDYIEFLQDTILEWMLEYSKLRNKYESKVATTGKK